MRISNLVVAISLFIGVGSFSTVARALDSGISLKSVAQVEIEVTDKEGRKSVERIPVRKAVPGSEVIYTTTFQNLMEKPIGNIVINNPIPNDSTYKVDSAFCKECEILFSVDGGKSFATMDHLKVKGSDGKDRLALSSDYTNIRWSYLGQLMAGNSGELGFRVVIK
jgi:uncharacterized repeat protein (TIGR01451 family)